MQLTELNSEDLAEKYSRLIFNLLVFVAILVTSLLLYVQPYCSIFMTRVVAFLVALCLANTIDFIWGLFHFINQELSVDDILEVNNDDSN